MDAVGGAPAGRPRAAQTPEEWDEPLSPSHPPIHQPCLRVQALGLFAVGPLQPLLQVPPLRNRKSVWAVFSICLSAPVLAFVLNRYLANTC